MNIIIFSKMETASYLVLDKLKEIIDCDSKLAIIPFAFNPNITKEEFENDYFPLNGERHTKYLEELKKINIKLENISVCNLFSQSTVEVCDIISSSDVLLFPGGNPEFLVGNISKNKEILLNIKQFKGNIIGVSAGGLVQFKHYFRNPCNSDNNSLTYHNGLDLVDNDFLIDVHTMDDKEYQSNLIKCANETNKEVYAIYDDGVIIYNRKTNTIEQYGNIKVIKPTNK